MRKVIFFLVCVYLCLTPISASAAGGNGSATSTWEFDPATGTLTISGTGVTHDSEYRPWDDYRNTVTHIDIQEGITEIGYGAFSHFSSLKTVYLPSSVWRIGQNAFADCTSLTDISIDSVSQIDNYAFSGCSAFTSVTIPSGVSVINDGVFQHCYRLQQVTFHNGVTKIGLNTFCGCESLTSITLPDSVSSLGSGAFRGCSSLQSVSLSNSLTHIGDNAFADCALTKILLPDQLTSISGNVFSGCSSLREVVIGAGVSNISEDAFNGCTSLTAFTVSSGNGNFSADGSALFNKSKTTLLLMPKGFSGTYTVPQGTQAIAPFAFSECNFLSSVTVPSSVHAINRYAFAFCSNLQTVKLSGGLNVIEESAFSNSGLTQITIPNTVKKLGDHVFAYCANLRKITFQGPAMDIGRGIFVNVTATAYYPGGDPSWSNKTGYYDGDVTWEKLSCNGVHTVTETTSQPATCTVSGSEGGTHCMVCGQVLTAPTPTPATGHSYGDWVVTRAPSMTEEGQKERKCSQCDNAEIVVLPKQTDSNQETGTAPEKQTEAPRQETEPIQTTPAGQETEPAQESPAVPTTEPLQTQPAKITVPVTDPAADSPSTEASNLPTSKTSSTPSQTDTDVSEDWSNHRFPTIPMVIGGTIVVLCIAAALLERKLRKNRKSPS